MNKTGFPIELTLPVSWGEMDSFKHVNNTIYFRYFEDIRIAYFKKIGALEEMERSQIGPILASTQCQFKLPLKYPDEVTIGACIRELKENRFKMYYLIYGHSQKKIVAKGEGKIVYYNYEINEKIQIPDALVKEIQFIERDQAMKNINEF